MPTYNYHCPACDERFTRSMSISCRDVPQDCECGETAAKTVAAGIGMVLKGDVWPGKNIQVKQQMRDRRNKVGRRENTLKRDGFCPSLVPNVDGEQVDSWDEAARLADSKGKSTSQYVAKARAEKAK